MLFSTVYNLSTRFIYILFKLIIMTYQLLLLQGGLNDGGGGCRQQVVYRNVVSSILFFFFVFLFLNKKKKIKKYTQTHTCKPTFGNRCGKALWGRYKRCSRSVVYVSRRRFEGWNRFFVLLFFIIIFFYTYRPV